MTWLPQFVVVVVDACRPPLSRQGGQRHQNRRQARAWCHGGCCGGDWSRSGGGGGRRSRLGCRHQTGGPQRGQVTRERNLLRQRHAKQWHVRHIHLSRGDQTLRGGRRRGGRGCGDGGRSGGHGGRSGGRNRRL